MLVADTTARAGTLAAKDHFLYTAVRGVIVCMNCESMEVVRVFDAYHKAVRSLLILNYSNGQSKPFDRILSRNESDNSSKLSLSSTSSVQSWSGKGSSSDSLRSQGTSHPRILHNDSFTSEDGSTNSILVSFGVGYKGVVRDCYAHPESFILPSEGNRVNHQLARLNKSLGCLLLWSTEVCNKNKINSNLQNLSEEEELPDDIVTSY